jgi:hypothetical protein
MNATMRQFTAMETIIDVIIILPVKFCKARKYATHRRNPEITAVATIPPIAAGVGVPAKVVEDEVLLGNLDIPIKLRTIKATRVQKYKIAAHKSLYSVLGLNLSSFFGVRATIVSVGLDVW